MTDDGSGRKTLEHGDFIFSIGSSSDNISHSHTLRL